jgi:apolipoprotein N-acyltransferase
LGTLRRRLALALVLGAVFGLGHVPFGAWWAALPALAGALALALPLTAGRAALLGLAFGSGHFLVALHWIVEPFLVDVERHGWMAPFGLLGLSVFMASYWGLAWGAGALAARGAPRLAAIPVALALAEMLRARAFTGFAWASPAYVWSETPVFQALAWVGPHGLALLTALAAGGLALAWRRPAPAPRRAALAAVPLAGLGALALLGAARGAPPAAQDAPVVRVVQPNAEQHLKWDPDWIVEFLRRGLESTAAEPGPLGAPDLVVWPEASIPYMLRDAGPALEAVARASGGAPAALGIQRRDGAFLHNSLVLTGPAGEVTALYDKHHLVPFGEFFPLARHASRLGLRGLAAEDGAGYAPGPGPRVVDVPGVGLALPLICYEAVFPRDVRVSPRPRLMLHVTNDAWFGTFAGPHQHLAQARARAIEQGLPVMRAANTGVSAAIDARGDVLGSLALGVHGHLDAALPRALPPPPYARTGDAPLAGLLLLALAVARRARPRAPGGAAAQHVDRGGPGA